MSTIKMLIGGKWVDREARRVQSVFDPSSGEPHAEVVLADTQDLEEALASTRKGFEMWRRTVPAERARILRQAATFIRRDRDLIADIISREAGKTISEAKGEIGGAIENLEWCADEGRRSYGRIVPAGTPDVDQMVVVEPVGPVAAFVAWNLPALNVLRKVSAALAAGCSIITKPSEETPETAVAIAERFLEAGLPPDVWNIVFGVPDEVSIHLLASPIIQKVSFTGSVPVGIRLQTLSAAHLKRCSMELGGHAPVIVFGDVNVNEVVRKTAAIKFRNAGQNCIAPSRFLVHQRIADEFIGALTMFAESIKVGRGADPGINMGPLINGKRLAAVEALVNDAVNKGAKVHCGGQPLDRAGSFYLPTVISNLHPDSRILVEESFGPVAPVIVFDDEDEAVNIANNTDYGLAGYIFSQDLALARRTAGRLDCGLIGINSMVLSTPETPFGGFKMSGYGFGGGIEGLETYQRKKFISAAYS